jgi:hypothetical protein
MIFPGQDFIPECDGAIFWNFNVSETEKKALQELRASP